MNKDIMSSNTNHILTVIGANLTAITIGSFNAVLGSISMSISIGYTLFRFYKDFKNK